MAQADLELMVAPRSPGDAHSMLAAYGETFDTFIWTDVIHLAGASVIASYSSGPYESLPAVTRYEQARRRLLHRDAPERPLPAVAAHRGVR